MRLTFIGFYFMLIFISGCKPQTKPYVQVSDNHYAKGFARSEIKGMVKLTVKNPWEMARNVSIDYYLVNRNRPISDSLSKKNIIRIPVQRAICLSTSHLAFLESLGELDKVNGISGSGYISNPFIREQISKGLIADVGYGLNLNFEAIISQQPDVVMVYGVDSEITGFLQKFSNLGIPVIMIAEYLEETPLGKAEWIKFVAALFEKEALSDSLFAKIEDEYNKLAAMANLNKTKPKVMVGFPFRDAWWIPGGKSYMAALIGDAGGDYIGKDNASHESFVISMEEAFARASDVNIWINVGSFSTKQEILSAESRFGRLDIFNNKLIYNNNKRSTLQGGNDFWESGTMHPNLILADLIRIFHPGILPADSLNYYKKIE